jgi:hypothetical protein
MLSPRYSRPDGTASHFVGLPDTPHTIFVGTRSTCAMSLWLGDVHFDTRQYTHIVWTRRRRFERCLKHVLGL